MYFSLSLKAVTNLVVWPVALILVIYSVTWGVPTNLVGWLRAISASILVYGIFAFLFGGFTGKYAPWRILWRVLPFLNDLIVPDLNGFWAGKTQSNWSRIDQMRDCAGSASKLDFGKLSEIDLKKDTISITAKQSLFRFSFGAFLLGTNSNSYPVSVRLKKNPDTDKFDLIYVYRQRTDDPAITDENEHSGSAILEINSGTPLTLSGMYWTNRAWQNGLNTAGLLALHRE